jgi:hypothetical protein
MFGRDPEKKKPTNIGRDSTCRTFKSELGEHAPDTFVLRLCNIDAKGIA